MKLNLWELFSYGFDQVYRPKDILEWKASVWPFHVRRKNASKGEECVVRSVGARYRQLMLNCNSDCYSVLISVRSSLMPSSSFTIVEIGALRYRCVGLEYRTSSLVA